MDVIKYSQRDPRWSNKYVGYSTLRFGSYGCTVTALTSLIDYVTGQQLTPDKVNNDLKKVGAFSGALIVWYRVPTAFPALRWVSRQYNYNNFTVSNYIYVKHIPVMVEVNAASIGAARHWVLFCGGRQMMDPWTGTIESTNKYPLTGAALFTKV